MTELVEILQLVADQQPAKFMEPKLDLTFLNSDSVIIDLTDTDYANRTDDYRIELETDIITYLMDEHDLTHDEVIEEYGSKSFLVHINREL